MENLSDIINGTILGDASINLKNSKYGKYFYYKLTAKDKRFLEWVKNILQKFKINNSWITPENNNFALHFYINNCPYPQFLSLRQIWYKRENNKTIKTVPRDIELTPKILLFWYLGDGCLVRRKNDLNRVPTIVLATNCFSKVDIEFLIMKLKQLNLNFYPIKYKSGYTGKESGQCLYSKTEDGTPLRFFKLIGLECPKEIANCSTGRKGIYKEEKFFKDKWPTEEDWIKILSNIKGVGTVLKNKRFTLRKTQKQLANLVDLSRESIKDVERGRRNFSVKNFRKVLRVLDIGPSDLLKELVD